MKTVISASRRTDIPAYYLPWFIDRIKEGYVEVANPFYRQQIRRVTISPRQVGWIVFWSRNYHRFIKKRSPFADYQLFFHFTILTPSILEKAAIRTRMALLQAGKLASLFGGNRITWRYDPLVFWREADRIQTNYDADDFIFLCRELAEMGITRCYTSVAHPYRKFTRRFGQKFTDSELIDQSGQLEQDIVREMSQVCISHGMQLYTCCTDRLLHSPDVRPASCIDGRLLNALSPPQKVSEARHATRDQCRCTRSIDIGDYLTQPCPTGCIYCYANPLWA